ncbi:hypothetical protein ACJX0J_037796, partial [Zea mays]
RKGKEIKKRKKGAHVFVETQIFLISKMRINLGFLEISMGNILSIMQDYYGNIIHHSLLINFLCLDITQNHVFSMDFAYEMKVTSIRESIVMSNLTLDILWTLSILALLKLYKIAAHSNIYTLNVQSFLAMMAKDEEDNEDEIKSDKKEHTFNRKNMKNFLNRKIIHQVLLVLDQVNMSNTRNENEVQPSYDDLANVVEKLGTLLEERNRKFKKLDVFVESLHAEISRLKTLIHEKNVILLLKINFSTHNTHASKIIKSLGNGNFETHDEPKKIVFKSTGIMLLFLFIIVRLPGLIP